MYKIVRIINYHENVTFQRSFNAMLQIYAIRPHKSWHMQSKHSKIYCETVPLSVCARRNQCKLSTYMDCFMTKHPDEWTEQETSTTKTTEAATEPATASETPSESAVKADSEAHAAPDKEGAALVITEPFKLHGLDVEPVSSLFFTRQRARYCYTQMQTIRVLETALRALKKGQMGGRLVECENFGQEAYFVGMRAAMRRSDKLITGSQCHSWAYLMGVSAFQVMAESCGKYSGPSHGKGGLMNIYGHNFFSSSGSPGSQVPLGGGIAFANKYSNKSGVCFTIYEAKAATNGEVYETFNMAQLWKLPCIFVCHNHKMCEFGVKEAKRTSVPKAYYKLGHYMPGICVNGSDLVAVLSATKFAIKHASQHGPLVLQINTSMTPTLYDPIQQFRTTCIESELITDDEANKIDRMVHKHVVKVASRAQQEEPVNSQELVTDVYAKSLVKISVGGSKC